MTPYRELSRKNLLELQKELQAAYKEQQAKGLKLDISRGKPGKEQLDLAMPMLDVLNSEADLNAADGTDVRNYGMLDGIPEAKKLMGDLMGVDPSQVIVFGNSSLNSMYDCIGRSMIFGVMGSIPWSKLDKVKFLCPVPGYDRHFAVTEQFGCELISIPMGEDGPDMDMVEEYVNNDPAVKGIWCVPLYSNPDGYSYSDETVRRLAAMETAAPDFKIMWDNAYCVHHLTDTHDVILNMLEECRKVGHEDRALMFCSLSKVTFPGAGVAAMAASRRNIDYILKNMFPMIISFDKLNQVRHIRFLKDMDGLAAHMEKHRALLEPKFRAVLAILDEGLSGCGSIARWTKPNGGYFLSLYTLGGCAKRTVQLCREAGVVLTDAGAAYPYGVDPQDSNIRIAPTFPPLDELETASRLLCVCVRIATLEKLLQRQ